MNITAEEKLMYSVMKAIYDSGIPMNFKGFLHRTDDLEHAYEKFRFAGDVDKPPFDEVYCGVKTYIKDILPREIDLEL